MVTLWKRCIGASCANSKHAERVRASEIACLARALGTKLESPTRSGFHLRRKLDRNEKAARGRLMH